MHHTPRSRSVLCTLVFSFTLAFASATLAQSPVEHIESREAFNAASSGLSTIDFGSVAPRRGFGMYRPPAGLTTNGVTFRTAGGARFGSGIIHVPSVDYMGTNPLYQTGTGEMITWGAPNQPGNASLDVTLPSGVTAVGVDLWTQQPYVSTVEVIATTEDGQSETVVVNTRKRPEAAFVGFIADKSIVSISFRPPKGQTGLLLDNFSFGRRAQGRPVQASARPSAQTTSEVAQIETPADRPSVSSGGGTSTGSSAVTSTTNTASRPSQASSTARASGTIAYIRGGTEIRLIESDGSNDRRLWTHEFAKEGSPYMSSPGNRMVRNSRSPVPT